MFPVLNTERLSLRPPRANDIDDLFALFSDPRITEVWSHEAWTERAQAESLLQNIVAKAQSGELFQWAITLAGVDRLIGTATLSAVDHRHRHCMIGYALMPSHQGKGYAREAAGALIRHAFTGLQLHRIGADLEPDNAGSRKLLEAFGFQVEGRLRDTYWLNGRWYDSLIMSLLESDWRARQSPA
ncbi:GNAT family N-acetyltransferase [Permianibacter sp. IMCC34836]|uniref:GNAT family N-acetyltransferase n=1 Tax=Permianibacter fluminis TaxID=2738515 RepID=UPI0015539647|nr:GNAT family protein [Permianibacter fluminis]NQD35921.1 GNAT family N-acetyltransferase [Permianibacter fluminis]